MAALRVYHTARERVLAQSARTAVALETQFRHHHCQAPHLKNDYG